MCFLVWPACLLLLVLSAAPADATSAAAPAATGTVAGSEVLLLNDHDPAASLGEALKVRGCGCWVGVEGGEERGHKACAAHSAGTRSSAGMRSCVLPA